MESTAPTLLSLNSVTKVFSTDEVETHALAGIELNVRKGEYISISGPSGCGKSTLLAILGLLYAQRARILALEDRPVPSSSAPRSFTTTADP